MILFLALVNIINLYYAVTFTHKLVNNTETNSTSYKNVATGCQSTKVINLIADVNSSAIKTLVPGVLMVVLSILLFKNVKSAKQSGIGGIIPCQSAKHLKAQSQFALTIFWLNTIFLILNFPILVMAIVKNFVSVLYKEDEILFEKQIINLVYNISYDLVQIYYGYMFFSFYYFNKLFKNEIISYFKIKLEKQSGSSRI